MTKNLYVLLLLRSLFHDQVNCGWHPSLQLADSCFFHLDQSLTGHTTPVESVKINTNEELIVAGSQSGSIRIWDLEAAKSRFERRSGTFPRLAGL